MAKINISIDDRLLERLDNSANDNYMSRSGLISLAVAQYLNTTEAVLALKNLSIAVRKIADTGNIDAETQKELEDFERIAKLIMGN